MNAILAVPLLALAVVGWREDRPGDAQRGSQLFQRHCAVCHSIHGLGGSRASDLALRPIGELTPSLFASAIWNAAPGMWRAAAARNLVLPALGPGDAADLFTYLRSLRYCDPLGDPAQGQAVFLSAGCGGCHATREAENPTVPNALTPAESIRWVQLIWNHTGRLSREARKATTPWPRLSAQQMADLVVYLQSVLGPRQIRRSAKAPDPAAGERLFEWQGCARCHNVGGPSGYGRSELLPRMARLHTITEFAVAMWNSAPRMHRRAADLGVDLLPFQGQEMGDLLAYLFEKRDLDERGDAGRGARIYQARGCAACHDNGQDGSSSLMPSRRRLPPFLLISALWKHGSQTAAELKRRGRTWPSLDHRDMADLVAYLNR